MSYSDTQLQIFNALSRFLPIQDDHQAFWWKLTGPHIARMMHEAEYPVHRQVEYLLFHRFAVIPRLGPQPTTAMPRFKSRVAAGAGDGTPIGYSWRWGLAGSNPYIRNYVEPLGSLTGTPADPSNEAATKELLWECGRLLPGIDLSMFWKFASHLRPNLVDEATREKFAGSSLLVGLEMRPESNTVDIKTYMYPRVPSQVDELLHSTVPKAMRDAYGTDVSLDSLNAVSDFMRTDPDGSQLVPPGTTAIDCCRPKDARVKFYVVSRNTSFDHIAAIMTLGGRKPAPPGLIRQLRELWYALKGLDFDFPTSDQLPVPDEGAASATNPNGLSFYFDIQPGHALPDVKAYFDVSKHSKSDMAAAEAVVSFLERHGRGPNPRAYINVLQGMVPVEELQTRRGVQAFFSVAFKKGEIDITSYFIPQAYRRFAEIKAELNEDTVVRQRRSRFE
ncbi:MAG: hypothetical protein Q9165_003039 [Trypethelium subeluteriae]